VSLPYPFLTEFADLDRGRCIIATSTKPGIWDWCGPLDGVRQVHDKMARLGIRTAQMKLEHGYALIGWWTRGTQTPKRRRF
jgi:hypothetical protein